MRAWTRAEAEKISKALQKVIDNVAKKNEENDRKKHAFSGAEVSQHTSAKAALQGLYGIKGTFDSIAFSNRRRK